MQKNTLRLKHGMTIYGPSCRIELIKEYHTVRVPTHVREAWRMQRTASIPFMDPKESLSFWLQGSVLTKSSFLSPGLWWGVASNLLSSTLIRRIQKRIHEKASTLLRCASAFAALHGFFVF